MKPNASSDRIDPERFEEGDVMHRRGGGRTFSVFAPPFHSE